MPLHSGKVVAEKRHLVRYLVKPLAIQFPGPRPLQSGAGVIRPIQCEVNESQVAVGHDRVGIQI